MTTKPVAVRVSQATRLEGSSVRQASRMASETWSAILSGCPSVTDSEVNKWRFFDKRVLLGSDLGVTSGGGRSALNNGHTKCNVLRSWKGYQRTSGGAIFLAWLASSSRERRYIRSGESRARVQRGFADNCTDRR